MDKVKFVPQSVTARQLWNYKDRFSSTDFLKQIELCGRKCYKSEDKITQDSAFKFVRGIVKAGHWSVTEFGTLDIRFNSISNDLKFFTGTEWSRFQRVGSEWYLSTSLRELIASTIHRISNPTYQALRSLVFGSKFYIQRPEDVLDFILEEIDKSPDRFRFVGPHKRLLLDITTSRTVTHELVRHRLFSFLQESQRYCKYDGELIIIDPESCYPTKLEGELKEIFEKFLEAASDLYDSLLNVSNGSAQFARMILPNQTKTEILVLGYLDYWQDWVAKQRSSSRAEPSMQRLFAMIKEFF